MSARQVFERFMEHALAYSPDQMVALYAPDAVLEMPFAPPGMPDREVGVEAMHGRLARGAQTRRHTGIDELVVHETPDPDKIIAEWRLHGEVIETGETFSRRFLMIIQTKDDRIVSARDYWDSMAVASLLARTSR